MDFENISQIITELASENIRLYPECYPISKDRNIYNEEACFAIETLSDSYWDNRSETEVARDKKAGVNKNDYLNFCLNALNEYAEGIKEPVDTSEYQED